MTPSQHINDKSPAKFKKSLLCPHGFRLTLPYASTKGSAQ